MAFNQGLEQLDKDRINAGIDDLVNQGKTEQEITSWRDAQVKAAAEGKINPNAGAGAPAGDGGSASGDGSSGFKPQTWNEFSGSGAGEKKPRLDDDGEEINLAKDFGDVGAFVESIPFIGDFIDDMYGAVKGGYAQGQTVDDSLALFAAGEDATPEQIQSYMEAYQNQQNQPVSNEMKDFNKIYEESGGGAWGFVKAIASNPSVGPATMLSSMVAMINPASAAGAGIGAAGGAAIGSAATPIGTGVGALSGAFAGAGGVLETASSFSEFLNEELAEKGLEFNEEGIAELLSDEDALRRMRAKSAARGGVISVIDGITGGLAGRAVKGVANTAKRASKLKSVLAGVGVEGAGGGIGEATARVAVGQELDAREIGLEIVGEFGTGVAIAKTALATQPKYEINGQRVSEKDIDILLESDPAAASTVNVENNPKLKAKVDEIVSETKDVNQNIDIITKSESEARAEPINKIRDAKKKQLKHKKKSPEYKAFQELINDEKAKIKDIVKEQNKNYVGLNDEQKSAIITSQTKIRDIDTTIKGIQDNYKEGQSLSTEDQAQVESFEAKKQEINDNADEYRAIGVAAAQQKVQAAQAKAQEKAQIEEQEAAEAEATELGTTVKAIEKSKEDVQSEISDDVQSNSKITEALNDSVVDYGIEIKPKDGPIDNSKAESYIPLSQENKDQFSIGDFEKDISSYEPRPLAEVKKAEIAIKAKAKQMGAAVSTKITNLPDGNATLSGTLTSPKREQVLSEKYKPAPAPKQQDEFSIEDGQGVIQSTAPTKTSNRVIEKGENIAASGGVIFESGETEGVSGASQIEGTTSKGAGKARGGLSDPQTQRLQDQYKGISTEIKDIRSQVKADQRAAPRGQREGVISEGKSRIQPLIEKQKRIKNKIESLKPTDRKTATLTYADSFADIERSPVTSESLNNPNEKGLLNRLLSPKRNFRLENKFGEDSQFNLSRYLIPRYLKGGITQNQQKGKESKEKTLQLEDLNQIAREGIILAHQDWKGGTAQEFFNLAKEKAKPLFNKAQKTAGAIALPQSTMELNKRILDATKKLQAQKIDEPTPDQIADYINDQPTWRSTNPVEVANNIERVAAVSNIQTEESPEDTDAIENSEDFKESSIFADVSDSFDGLTQNESKIGESILGKELYDKLSAEINEIFSTAPVGENFTEKEIARSSKDQNKQARRVVLDELKGENLTKKVGSKGLATIISDLVDTSNTLEKGGKENNSYKNTFTGNAKLGTTPQAVYEAFLGPKKDRVSEKAQDTLRDQIADTIVNEIENESANANVGDEFSVGANADPKQVKEAVDHLQELNPNTKFITDKKQISEVAKRNGLPKSVADRVRGAYTKEGNVLLNLDNIGMDTPFHEVGHGWLKNVKSNHPKFYAKAEALARNSKTYRGLKTNPDYSAYPEARLLEEVMATDIGLKGAEIFADKRDATKWDNWVNKAKAFVAKAFGMDSKAFEKMTYGEFIEGAATDITTGGIDAKTDERTDEFSTTDTAGQVAAGLDSDMQANPDLSAARIRGEKAKAKWYKPGTWGSLLAPPASDDYHGLVSKIDVKDKDKVTKAFVDNHESYTNASTDARKLASDTRKKLKAAGIKLDKKNVATINGAKLNAAQAIQAHVNGFENDFAKQPAVQEYIKSMESIGLKPTESYDNASPDADIVNYILNDLYKQEFADFNELKSEVFNEDVMNSITEQHGDNYSKALNNALQRMSTGKTSTGQMDPFTQKLNDWALGSVGAVMFLNFRSAALQLISVGNYGFAAKNPTKFWANLAVGIAKAPFDMLNPNSALRQKFDGKYLSERRARAGFDVNASDITDRIRGSKDFSDMTKKVLNAGFKATSFMDSMAAALGGVALEKADGKEFTETKWREATEEAQQSSRPDRVSQWQTSGASKYILAFANTPMQYFRLSQKAARTIRSKDASTSEKMKALRKIGYYMAVQNAIFTAAQSASMALLSGFTGDDEEDKKALNAYNSMTGTVLRGMGFYGAIIDSGKNVIVEAIKQEGKARPDHVASLFRAASISPPLSKKINDLFAIGRAHNYNNEDKWTITAAKGITTATNLPTDWVYKKGKAVGNLANEQFSATQKLLMLMGYSEYQFDNKEADKKKGKFNSKKKFSKKFKSKKFEGVKF